MSLEKRPGDVVGAFIDTGRAVGIVALVALVGYETLVHTPECPRVLKKCPSSIVEPVGQLITEQFNSLRARLMDFS